MDYYETVMLHYLRADRVIFLNSEYCTQLNEAANPDMSGPHWYCDAVATDFRNKAIFLCEISYSKGLQSLTKRLREWHADWNGLRLALIRDSFLHGDHAQSRPHRLFATTLASIGSTVGRFG
jgi:hypothetical protein